MTLKQLCLPGLFLFFTVSALAAEPGPVANTPLPWAYAVNTPGVTDTFDYDVPKSLPDSDLQFVFSFPRNLYQPPDWHPDDHPVMPGIVAGGREPGVFACAYCHLPNGQGRPENASLAGLPEAYIIQQMADWRAGLRQTSEPRHGPANNMRAIGNNATDDEVRQAAAYFSSLTPRPWIRVVERATVPETVVAGWMYIEKTGGGREAIGDRILEMPQDLERVEMRDDHTGFIAFVPPGSLARGKALVEAGACATCHGEGLHGLGPVPYLAGRSPSYIARQLYDFKVGNRHGLWSPLMQAVVEDLSVADITAIAAYTASLSP